MEKIGKYKILGKIGGQALPQEQGIQVGCFCTESSAIWRDYSAANRDTCFASIFAAFAEKKQPARLFHTLR